MSYISKIQIGNNESLIGSTLYGRSLTPAATPAKTVGTRDDSSEKFINSHYDTLVQGTTIHVKFVYGNSATSNITLAVGSLSAKAVVGKFVCGANTIISFTLDENENWVVNDNIDNDTTYTFSEGNTNGAFSVSVNGGSASSVNIHGLGNSAYKGYVENISNNPTSTDLPTAEAVVNYVNTATSGLAGLTGAMHFKGTTTTAITDGGTENPTIGGTVVTTKEAGDVVLYGHQEFVWNGNTWELLGDEGSYALKSSTDTITEFGTWNAGAMPTLTVDSVSIPNITNVGTAAALETEDITLPNVTNWGSAAEFIVSQGVLQINPGAAPSLSQTDITVKSVKTWSAGSAPTLGNAISVGSVSDWQNGTLPSLTTNDTIVVVPTSSST